jgi:hypothetical protein
VTFALVIPLDGKAFSE